jgi:hypothetical protein
MKIPPEIKAYFEAKNGHFETIDLFNNHLNSPVIVYNTTDQGHS